MPIQQLPSGHEYFRSLRDSARNGTLSPNAFEQILAQDADPQDHISILRFALRLGRRSLAENVHWPILRDIEAAVAAIYRSKIDSTQDPAQRFAYTQWASRYGSTGLDLSEANSELFSLIKDGGDSDMALQHLINSDLTLKFDFPANKLYATSRHADSLSLNIRPQIRLNRSLLWCRRAQEEVHLEFSTWSLSMRTHEGPKSPNEDAAVFASYSDGSFLVAVADGTGDSHDGSRAADVALQALADALAMTGQLTLATEMASSAVRADNLLRKEENSCTLVALHVTDGNAKLVHLSDPFHWIQEGSGASYWSPFSASGRSNVGGEPFGYIITSSGNYVDCFKNFKTSSPDTTRQIADLRAFLIGCDGLIPSDPKTLKSGECPVTIDFTSSGLPQIVAKNCLFAAHESMKENRRTSDNITCIAGYRRG